MFPAQAVRDLTNVPTRLLDPGESPARSVWQSTLLVKSKMLTTDFAANE
jgi:hypothetical protein